uniref:Uncharacterized protein n=1 Tax=Palpitomonas bilix TaxID=652834 RepID=A0A7S3DG81_9EUKA|mmetsp:Transcript_36261/g.94312  ORF Transcript_36261/g.94312 Transcript_36261/m.94312 type:complete len:548 (+) Transcript_36261:146-1789(+)
MGMEEIKRRPSSVQPKRSGPSRRPPPLSKRPLSVGSALKKGLIHLASPLIKKGSNRFGVLLSPSSSRGDPTDHEIENKQNKKDKKKFIVLGLWGTATVLFWIVQTVSRRSAGLALEHFPVFLTWSSTLGYVPFLFALWGVQRLAVRLNQRCAGNDDDESNDTESLAFLSAGEAIDMRDIESGSSSSSSESEAELEPSEVELVEKNSPAELQSTRSSSSTAATRPVPQKWLVFFGFLTAIASYLELFSSSSVSGEMQSLLGPTVGTIPLAMIFSAIFVKWRPHIVHILASLLIIGGVLIVALPSLLDDSEESTSSMSALWDIVFFSSTIPLALMTVFEERAFEKFEVNAYKMASFEVLYEFIFTVLMLPLALIPGFGPTTPGSFVSDNAYALQCFFNLGFGNETTIQIGDEVIPVAELHCDQVWAPWLVYVLSFGLSNLAQIATVQYGSAVFSFICVAISAPLSEFAFAIPGIETPEGLVLQWNNFVSLLLLVAGVFAYVLADHLQRKKRRKARRKARALSQRMSGRKSLSDVIGAEGDGRLLTEQQE